MGSVCFCWAVGMFVGFFYFCWAVTFVGLVGSSC